MKKALIFSIEEFSVFDGPGMRTSVFLMGCPLRCEWCHNPEGQRFSNFILRSPNGCLRCGECEKYTTVKNGTREFSEESIIHCPNKLLRYCGEEMSAEELCRKLEKNLAILNAAGGGVTFSGGEPLMQTEFLSLWVQMFRKVSSSNLTEPFLTMHQTLKTRQQWNQ